MHRVGSRAQLLARLGARPRVHPRSSLAQRRWQSAQSGESRRQDANNDQGDEKSDRAKTTGDANASFFNAFAASVRRQMNENRQMQDNIKALSAETSRLAESDAVKRARDLAESGGKTTSQIAEKVGTVVTHISESPAVQRTAAAVGKSVDAAEHVAEKAAEPVLNTRLAQTLRHELLDSSTDHRWIEYKPRAEREARDAARLARQDLARPGERQQEAARAVAANPDAGADVTLHQSSRFAASWKQFKEESPLMQRLFSVGRSLEETDSPVLDVLRGFRDRVQGLFEETETARVNRAFALVEPGFRTDRWLKWATETALPDILESLLQSDVEALREWCSEATFSVLEAHIVSQQSQGLVSACRLLDLRDVELQSARMLEDEVPVLVLTFKTQEVLFFRNAKTGEAMVGKEDAIEHASYACVFGMDRTVDPASSVGPRTRGWRMLEFAKHGSSRGV